MATPDQNPQDVLRQEIIGDARRQAERTLRRARQDAEAIIARAEADSSRERARLLDQARAGAERRTALVLAKVPVETGRMRSARIESLLQDIHDEARRRLKARDGVCSREDLIRLAAEAARGMEGVHFVLQLPAAARLMLGDAWLPEVSRLAGKPDLDVQLAADLADDDAGLILRDRAGRQIWDSRLAVRLTRMWPALRVETALLTALLEPVSPAENTL